MHSSWQLHQSWPLSRPTFISLVMCTNLVNHKRKNQTKPKNPKTPLSCIDMQRLQQGGQNKHESNYNIQLQPSLSKV